MPLKFYQNVTLKTQLFWLIGPYAKEASVIWISFFFFYVRGLCALLSIGNAKFEFVVLVTK